jgi:hypothetical protein
MVGDYWGAPSGDLGRIKSHWAVSWVASDLGPLTLEQEHRKAVDGTTGLPPSVPVLAAHWRWF